MNKFFLLLATVMTISFATAQTTVIHDANARERTLAGSFSKISVSSGIELFISQASEAALAISVSDEKYEPFVKSEIRNGTLHLFYDVKGYLKKADRKRRIKAYVSVNSLEAITAASGARVQINQTFNSNSITLHFSSGATFNGSITSTLVKANVSSGAEISLSGNSSEYVVTASSGASVKGKDFTVATCTAKASSGGAINVVVEKALNASASSGGEIRYSGAADVSKNTSSGGSVVKGS